MARYDSLVEDLGDALIGDRNLDTLCWNASDAIKHLQDVIRSYNPDDAIFDDEERPAPEPTQSADAS